ncbi:histidine kinase [Ramlibacter tataouinensis]|uniref:histidine kinase n=2 Tax=Ramlibacter tataouinensis TaxID=94132 RepID=A0A140HL64_9BURK|nr:histidine kinase [Ramlibacter tataouinensis]
MLSPEGEVVSWNAGAQRFKGYTAQEIIGQHFSRFYTEEDRAAGVPENALKLAREAGQFEAEGWRVRKDGSRFWANVVIDPIRDERGELVGFAKITRDITDRKLAQEALRQSEERFRILVQGVTDYAIYMLSPEGEITNWNAGARRIKGYAEHEVVGTNFSRFYTEEDRATGLPQRALAQAAEKGRFEAEGWRVRKDGSRFWAHVLIDPIRNELGELIGFAKVTRDITERKNAATELEQAREALFQAQKLEAIGKLTGGVAHDFNNLLNVVTNGLSSLRERLRDPADIRMLDAMDKAASRGTALTRQLLSFARQQPLRPEPQELNQLITSFEAVLRRGSRSAISFDLDLAAGLPQVLVDSALFESALLNLVVNARDATPDGGSIVLSTRVVELKERQVGALTAGPYVAVAVQDTGTGMPADVVARAVEPFFTTKEVGKGTGLGLSQVVGMAQQSGGDLGIHSRVGQGTTITMYFPALPATAAPSEAGKGGTEKVLVVDDQPEVLEVTSELFRILGFEVLVANSGQQALEMLQRTPDVRLILSDMVMPGMNGLQLGQKAKELVPGVKLILASGYTDAAIGNGMNLAGFHFLPKPYRMGDLVKKLRSIGLASERGSP